MSSTFEAILERKLGRKVARKGTQRADLLVAMKSKGLELNIAMQARGADVFTEDTVEDINESMNQRLEDIINDTLIGFSFFEESSSRVSFTNKGKVDVPKAVYGLLDKRRRPISALSLARLLNLILVKHVKELMGNGRRLNNVTGRLANSFQVTGIDQVQRLAQQRKNRVSVFFTYQLAPYATFETGGKQHLPGRQPSKLGKEALRSALREALHADSFDNNIFETVFEGRNI